MRKSYKFLGYTRKLTQIGSHMNDLMQNNPAKLPEKGASGDACSNESKPSGYSKTSTSLSLISISSTL